MTGSLFDTAALDKSLKRVIPPSDDNAIVAEVDETTGLKVALHMTKKTKRGRWQLSGIYEHHWNGDDTFAGQAIFSWKS